LFKNSLDDQQHLIVKLVTMIKTDRKSVSHVTNDSI